MYQKNGKPRKISKQRFIIEQSEGNILRHTYKMSYFYFKKMWTIAIKSDFINNSKLIILYFIL